MQVISGVEQLGKSLWFFWVHEKFKPDVVEMVSLNVTLMGILLGNEDSDELFRYEESCQQLHSSCTIPPTQKRNKIEVRIVWPTSIVVLSKLCYFFCFKESCCCFLTREAFFLSTGSNNAFRRRNVVGVTSIISSGAIYPISSSTVMRFGGGRYVFSSLACVLMLVAALARTGLTSYCRLSHEKQGIRNLKEAVRKHHDMKQLNPYHVTLF